MGLLKAATLAFFAHLVLTLSPGPARATYAPKVAVVLCQQNYNVASERRRVHSSSQALVGLAGLAGAPDETVLLDELLARPAGTFNSIWFSDCSSLSSGTTSTIASYLETHLERGGSVLLDGPIGAYDVPGAGAEPSFRGLDEIADAPEHRGGRTAEHDQRGSCVPRAAAIPSRRCRAGRPAPR